MYILTPEKWIELKYWRLYCIIIRLFTAVTELWVSPNKSTDKGLVKERSLNLIISIKLMCRMLNEISDSAYEGFTSIPKDEIKESMGNMVIPVIRYMDECGVMLTRDELCTIFGISLEKWNEHYLYYFPQSITEVVMEGILCPEPMVSIIQGLESKDEWLQQWRETRKSSRFKLLVLKGYKNANVHGIYSTS